MKFLIVLFGLLAWIGCHDESNDINTELHEVDATWSNMLAVDGCSWHFTVVAKDTAYSLLPDDASRLKIDQEVGKSDEFYMSTNVRLKYVLTGSKRTVQCGWGATNTYDEIKVISISKR